MWKGKVVLLDSFLESAMKAFLIPVNVMVPQPHLHLFTDLPLTLHVSLNSERSTPLAPQWKTWTFQANAKMKAAPRPPRSARKYVCRNSQIDVSMFEVV